MREIEIKVRVHDKQKLVDALEKNGIQLSTPKKQHDVVYAHPGAMDNAPGENWLRIRIENDDKAIFTLKRSVTSELDSIEHETEVADAEELRKIIGYLGYSVFSDLTKTRQKAKVGDIEICVDEVPELGVFIEAERLTDEDADQTAIFEELWQFVERFGVSRSDEETSGYDVLLNRLKAKQSQSYK
jgi:adenylate cyclase, class 2